ncbi:hypothetical protein LTR91_015751 [Friedmanniomyces endolithicus]|uniref:F-box domain-containing protein n=1 Tax=Friedmanniomyces endolithicus TaxID=329885 RepID=A0AAN6QLF5_9PEZI|nr:hypothetical protein LTR94_018271 [Friedmanniomyces endolithicus]KAK0787290.1 hypothetical protein LTR38_011713 [Friedmanniomyces endolithicus]KAK0794850.1 hypothetical protein LTR75_010692 [Friedmanniomyces endolithicus]KAK0912279.1 hypothetical protein LTR57_014960 [Friedmanniomyces endolithicus]KAK0970896.1 hypothetical protein LTR91_015751 [Friedmanniomyces endolithicus]
MSDAGYSQDSIHSATAVPLSRCDRHLAKMQSLTLPQKKLRLSMLPQELKNKIYSLLFPSGRRIRRIKLSECAKTNAWNAFEVIRVVVARFDVAILQVDKATNKEATDVLLARNIVTLEVGDCCSTHGAATVRAWSMRQSLLDQPYRNIRLQLSSRRYGCNNSCVAGLVQRIAAVLKTYAVHKLTVELSMVSPEDEMDLRSAPEAQEVEFRYPEVGTVVTTLSSTEIHFVHMPIREAWKVMSRLPPGRATWPVMYEHPEAIWSINETHPWVVRSLGAFLSRYKAEEVAFVTQYAMMGFDLNGGQGGEE